MQKPIDVRGSTLYVVQNSVNVRIDQKAVERFSRKINIDSKNWIDSSQARLNAHTEREKAAFLVFFNSMSFCYWPEPRWQVSTPIGKVNGAYGLLYALGRALAEKELPLDGKAWSRFGREKFERIAGAGMPMQHERVAIIRQTGDALVRHYDGEAVNLFEAAEGNAMGLLADILAKFESFQDSVEFMGRKIEFAKRAQLLVSDAAHHLKGRIYDDIGNITACADYKLPQVLRQEGVLVYGDSLAEKVDGKMTIERGSPEEIEIRANTIWAVEKIREQKLLDGVSATSIQINDVIWRMGQDDYYRQTPYHRTITCAY